ncbi:MAG: hypothetical protein WAR77_04435 [Saprospiraceae bacterium]
MDQYFGVLEIRSISNIKSTEQSTKSHFDFKEMDSSNVQFVHYPDCQQLLIWLPNPGMQYGSFRILQKENQSSIDQFQVPDKLSGSIQIIIDSSFIPPGIFNIIIDHNTGNQHTIDFEKYATHEVPKSENDNIEIKPDNNLIKESINDRKRYQDGFGNPIMDDIDFRNEAIDKLVRKFQRKLEYKSTGRAGTVTYVDGDIRISFEYDMGASPCMVYIMIPSEATWEAETKQALENRAEILEFVAITAQRDQASNCYFEIHDQEIAYYYKD